MAASDLQTVNFGHCCIDCTSTHHSSSGDDIFVPVDLFYCRTLIPSTTETTSAVSLTFRDCGSLINERSEGLSGRLVDCSAGPFMAKKFGVLCVNSAV